MRYLITRTICLIVLLVSTYSFSHPGYAEDPSAIKEQANSQVMVASRLMQQGMAMAQSATSPESRQASMQLLIEAGQLFEKASLMYQSLMPQYATQSDVDNSRKAMENCINVIAQLKQGLRR